MTQLQTNTILKGIALSITAFAFFSVADVTVKLLSNNYTILQIFFYQTFCSVIGLIIAAPWFGGLKKSIISPKWKLHSFRAIISIANGLLGFYGLSMLPMAKFYTIFFCAPFITSILSIPLMKEKIGWHRWLAIAAGFIGVLVALRPGVVPLDLASLAVIVAATIFSLNNVLVKVIGSEDTPLSFSIYPAIFRLTLLTPFAMPLIDIPSFPDLFLIISGGFLFAFGAILISLTFRHAPSAVAAPFHYTQIVWGVIFGYYVFGDTADKWTLAGAAIIIASGLYLVYRENKTKGEITAPAYGFTDIGSSSQ